MIFLLELQMKLQTHADFFLDALSRNTRLLSIFSVHFGHFGVYLYVMRVRFYYSLQNVDRRLSLQLATYWNCHISVWSAH